MNATVATETKRRFRLPQPVAVPTSKSSRQSDHARKRRSKTSPLSGAPQLSRIQVNKRLQHALISINRGLLQYASQCAPWTPASETDCLDVLHRLAAMQQDSIQQLCDVLVERRDAIEWGVFHSKFTSYNYLSLDFIWPKITAYQTQLVRLLETMRDELHHDTQTRKVLGNVIRTERGILEELTANSTLEAPPVSIAHGQTRRVLKPLQEPPEKQLSAV